MVMRILDQGRYFEVYLDHLHKQTSGDLLGVFDFNSVSKTLNLYTIYGAKSRENMIGVKQTSKVAQLMTTNFTEEREDGSVIIWRKASW
jgi:hypothetical protein